MQFFLLNFMQFGRFLRVLPFSIGSTFFWNFFLNERQTPFANSLNSRANNYFKNLFIFLKWVFNLKKFLEFFIFVIWLWVGVSWNTLIFNIEKKNNSKNQLVPICIKPKIEKGVPLYCCSCGHWKAVYPYIMVAGNFSFKIND